MIRPSLRAFLGAASILAGCGDVNTALDTVCDSKGCISLSRFSANLKSALDGKVTGYAFVVGGLPQPESGGFARTPTDSPMKYFNVGTQMNIASVSKTLTAIAVLQVLAKHKLTVDDKIAAHLPLDWMRGPNVDTITFRELLTHSAGFRDNGNGANTTYAVLQQQIADGVKLGDKIPLYNNLDFAIFRVLIPDLDGFSDSDPATRPARTAQAYIDYLRKNVFLPVGVTTADCRNPSGVQPTLYYPSPPGTSMGVDPGDWTLACGGGGWVLSVSDLFKVMLSLTADNLLLTDEEKATMNSGCLGWDCAVATQNDYVGKNGLLQTNSAWLETFAGIFKGKVYVVVFANSPPAKNITNVVEDAFNAAAISQVM